MTLRRALLQLGICYPLSIVAAIVGAFAFASRNAGGWLVLLPVLGFYWFLLSTLWNCYRKRNVGFLLAFVVVGVQAALMVLVMSGVRQEKQSLDVIFMAIPVLFSIVGFAGAWEAYRIERWVPALLLAWTGLAVPTLYVLDKFPPVLGPAIACLIVGSIPGQCALIINLGLVCEDYLVEITAAEELNDIGIGG